MNLIYIRLSSIFIICIDILINDMPPDPRIGITLEGAFLAEDKNSSTHLSVYVQLVQKNSLAIDNNRIGNGLAEVVEVCSFSHRASLHYYSLLLLKQNISVVWYVPIVSQQMFDNVTEIRRSTIFDLGGVSIDKINNKDTELRIVIEGNFGYNFAFLFTYDPTPMDVAVGVIYATIVLLGLYIMIIWEVSVLFK